MPFYRNLYFLGAFQVALYAVYVAFTDYVIPFGKDLSTAAAAARSDVHVPVDFPVNFTKAYSDTAPKIIFNAFFKDLDLKTRTLIIGWNVSPAAGECETDAPVTVANIFYADTISLVTDGHREKPHLFFVEQTHPMYVHTLQYISKDACAKPRDTIDFTTINRASRFDRRETIKSIFIRERSHHAGTYARVKYNGTDEAVPVAFTKAADLPHGSHGRLEAIVYNNSTESRGGIVFDYYISRNSRTAFCDWILYWRQDMMLVVSTTLLCSSIIFSVIYVTNNCTLPFDEAFAENCRILRWFLVLYVPLILLLIRLTHFTHCPY